MPPAAASAPSSPADAPGETTSERMTFVRASIDRFLGETGESPSKRHFECWRLEKAEGAAAKRKARKRVKKAKRAFLAAHEDKVFACSNNPPSFPSQNVHATFDNSYDGLGCLVAVTAEIEISPGASDPDGDSLTYGWSASNGIIHGSGLHATWRRAVTRCDSVPGTDTVTANDGRGGTGSFHYEFGF